MSFAAATGKPALIGEHRFMPDHPLAEVFGFPIDNMTPEASQCRKDRCCPYNNNAAGKCTKSSVENPLGVCSVFGSRGEVVITCPSRFREGWRIERDAAAFFFSPGTSWKRVTEVRLKDDVGEAVGNVDVVVVSLDTQNRILDYGSLEVQSVYISGNVRLPFQYYMDDPAGRHDMNWRGQPKYPRPDYLSSSRKRLAPQLISKGGIFNAWGRKMAVALDLSFYNTLPALEEVAIADADMAWFVYDLRMDATQNRYVLELHKTVYTSFEQALLKITRSEAGEERVFLTRLQEKINRRLNSDGIS